MRRFRWAGLLPDRVRAFYEDWNGAARKAVPIGGESDVCDNFLYCFFKCGAARGAAGPGPRIKTTSQGSTDQCMHSTSMGPIGYLIRCRL